MEKLIFNADDEEPCCHACDNIECSYEFCEKNCGSKHGWSKYQRTEILEENNKRRA